MKNIIKTFEKYFCVISPNMFKSLFKEMHQEFQNILVQIKQEHTPLKGAQDEKKYILIDKKKYILI